MSDVEAFSKGASAMQAQIAAWLMFRGFTDLAAKVLEQPLPKFYLPEVQTIASTKE